MCLYSSSKEAVKSTPSSLRACTSVSNTTALGGISNQYAGTATSSNFICRELFQMGERCFDVDIVTTADHQLLVTHPTSIQVTHDTLKVSVRSAIASHAAPEAVVTSK